MSVENYEELQQLWEEAVEKYASGSKRESAVLEKWKTLVKSGTDLDKLISEHESDFSKFRSSGNESSKKIWAVFKVTMTQLRRLGSVAKAGVGLTPFAPATILIEACLFLIDSGAKVTDDYNILEELFQRIRNISDRVDEYLQGGSLDTTDNPKLHRVVVHLLCALLAIFCEAEAAIRRGSGRQMMQRVAGKKNGIQDALDDLDKMVNTEMELVTAKTYSTVQRIDANAEADRQREFLQQALYTNAVRDNKAYHAGVENTRIEHSGTWLLQQRLYQEWKHMEFPVLCLLGSPGTGKTYVASRVVSDLQDGGVVSAYFYIREGMNTQHTLDVILRTLAMQITEQDRIYRKQAVQICRNDNNMLLPETLWDSLFVRPFSDTDFPSRSLFIVIDGVDEALPENQEKLVELAKILSDARKRSSASPSIQILLVGRPELEQKVFNVWDDRRWQLRIFHIIPSLSKKDIRHFIQHGVNNKNIPLLRKMGRKAADSLRESIIKKLIKNADGMFMLVKLMLAEIKDMNKPELIRQALSKPPKGLDDMFQRVISRLVIMSGFDKDDLNEMIMWVACAKRDLTLRELDLVLKVRDLGQNGVVGLDDELRTRFGSFFSVPKSVESGDNEDAGMTEDEKQDDEDISVTDEDTESDHHTDRDEKDEGSDDEKNDGSDEDEYGDEEQDDFPPSFTSMTVKFSHASVGQYFHKGEFHEDIGMNVNQARAHVTTTCLLFLNGNVPKRNEKPWNKPDLYSYSANYFLDHLLQIDFDTLDATTRSALSQEIADFFQDRKSLLEWFKFVFEDPRIMCQLFSEEICSRLRACIVSEADEMGPNYQWLHQAKTSTEVLLQPFAKAVARWIHQNDCDDVLAILFLHGYKSTCHADPLVLPLGRSFEQIVQCIPPAEILELATLDQYTKDDDWYANLGVVLGRIKTIRHQLAAVEQFRLASQKSKKIDDIQDARISEARTLVLLGQYKKAIVAAESVLSTLQKNQDKKLSNVLEIIRNSYSKLANHEAALETALKIWKLKPTSAETTYATFWAVHLAGNYQETVRILRMILEKKFDSSSNSSFLGSVLLKNYYAAGMISYACAQTGELDLARDAYLTIDSTHYAWSQYKSKALLSLGQLYYQFYRDDSKACEIWKDVIENFPPDCNSATTRTSFELASVYFTKAIKVEEEEAEEADVWITKLKELVAYWQPQMTINLDNIMTPRRRQWSAKYGRSSEDIPGEELSALLGQWHALHGRTDLAREAIRPLLRLALTDLFDTDDTNDNDAYKNLAQALYCFRDNEKAAIASAMEMPQNVRRRTNTSEETEVEETAETTEPDSSEQSLLDSIDAPFHFPRGCDGLCKHDETEYQSFTICAVCIDIGFCDECFPKLQDGSLPIHICDPSHPHFEIYPPRGLVSKGEDGFQVHLKDGNVISSYDWLSSIKKEWEV